MLRTIYYLNKVITTPLFPQRQILFGSSCWAHLRKDLCSSQLSGQITFWFHCFHRDNGSKLCTCTQLCDFSVSNAGCVNVSGQHENGGRADRHCSGHPSIWIPVAGMSFHKPSPGKAGKGGAVLVPYVGRPEGSWVVRRWYGDWLECTGLGHARSQTRAVGPISSVWWEKQLWFTVPNITVDQCEAGLLCMGVALD